MGFRIRGRVQGVGFRWWTMRSACARGLGGAVWNVSDGSVRVDAFGPPGALERLADELRRGPAGARVDEVERCAPEVDPRADFEIRR